MTLTELIDTLFPPGHPNRPVPAQEAILRHPQGLAWVLDGPGSGKTEVLTLLVLRLLYVENDPAQSERIQPEAILVTTFTEKAREISRIVLVTTGTESSRIAQI